MRVGVSQICVLQQTVGVLSRQLHRAHARCAVKMARLPTRSYREQQLSPTASTSGSSSSKRESLSLKSVSAHCAAHREAHREGISALQQQAALADWCGCGDDE